MNDGVVRVGSEKRKRGKEKKRKRENEMRRAQGS